MKNYLSIFSFYALVMGLLSCTSNHHENKVVELTPVTVQVQTVNPLTAEETFTVSGHIQPEQEANLSTRLMGYIEKINANVGDRVHKGKVLVSISNADLEAKLAQVKTNTIKAEVGLQNAEKDYNRYTTLFSQNSITQKELDDITAHYNLAKASLEATKQMEKEVKAQLRYTRITSPFTGTITAKYVDVGEMAKPGIPLLTIATNDYQAVAMIPENKITKIEKGQKAKVWIKSLGEELSGVVQEIAVSSQHSGSQYIVKIDLEKSTNPMYTGMFTTVKFAAGLDSESSTLFIPEQSIIKKGNLKGVYTVGRENTAILRWLRLGRKVGENYEVLSGLRKGEKIIVSANSRLFNGSPLQY